MSARAVAAAALLAVFPMAMWGCSDSTVPIDPREEAPLGDLYPIGEQLRLEGLRGPVDAVRDADGRTHIYATNVPDAMLVQGYLIARDRHLQLEFFRRVAEGRVAEILGFLDPTLVETDIGFRHLGLLRVAKQIYEQASADARAALEAYASGVSQLFAEIRSGSRPIAEGLQFVEPEHFGEWRPEDSIAVGRLQSWLLSYDDDTPTDALLDDLRSTFAADDPDPAVAARAGMERDYMRMEPPRHATVIPSIDHIGTASLAGPPDARTETPTRAPISTAGRSLIEGTRRVRAALDRGRRWLAPAGDFGSNNWAVSGQRTASGRAMVASDPHLSLSSPAVFWPVNIHVEHRGDGPQPKDLDVGGLAFAGIPGLILGHNKNVAWGATVASYDVTDTYAEELAPSGDAVIFQGQEVPLETVEEDIDDGNGHQVVYDVKIVPHHGPILPTIVDGQVVDPDPAEGALSVRWTGFEPSGELEAVFGLLGAEDVDDARASLAHFEVGAQNWMLADTSGNILWTTHSRVPYRDERALAWDADGYEGLLPCLVLPGDGTAEWTGDWPDDAVPWAKNPMAGYLATANNDQVGTTLDNDPSNDQQADGTSAYLTCRYDPGFREARIQERIEGHHGLLTLDDLSNIQGDHRSALGSDITPALLLAIENAQAEKASPGTHPDLAAVVADPAYDLAFVTQLRDLLVAWRDIHDYEAASGVSIDDNQPLALTEPEAQAAQATLLFNVWYARFSGRVFGDELARIGRPSGGGFNDVALLHLLSSDPPNLATYDPATGDSALWDDLDTPETESRQERMIRALLDATAWLADHAGPIEDWRWGSFHTIRFAAPAPVWDVAIPNAIDNTFPRGYPRPGDMYVIDACNHDDTVAVAGDLDFSYDSGPTQRFVAELDPAGLRTRNALPGGAVWDKNDPHFADQATSWLRNQTLEVPFELDDVLAAAEKRTLLLPPAPQ